MIRQKSIKGLDVLQFFKQLRQKLEGPLAVILDNASIHKTLMVRDYCEKNGIYLLFLPAYTPQLQPIENVWAMIKRDFRKQILKQMIGQEEASFMRSLV